MGVIENESYCLQFGLWYLSQYSVTFSDAGRTSIHAAPQDASVVPMQAKYFVAFALP